MRDTRLVPYLTFNGNCAEAMQFYHHVLGGKLDMQKFGESGQPVPEEQKNRVIHAHLEHENILFMASDSMPDKDVVMGENVHLSLNGSDETWISMVFEKLSESGTVDMPLAKQFWGDTFGMLTDKFGVHWMVNISRNK